MKLLIALLPTIILVVYGQLVTKWRLEQLSDAVRGSSGPLDRLVVYLSDPYILSAYAVAFASSMTWMFVVERHALSLAYPLYIGLTVLAVTVGGVFLFGEQMTPSRVLAVILIVAGVIVGVRS